MLRYVKMLGSVFEKEVNFTQSLCDTLERSGKGMTSHSDVKIFRSTVSMFHSSQNHLITLATRNSE